MLKLDLAVAAAACEGELSGGGEITSVCTDTRKTEKGCLFIALQGDNFNGHDFTKNAVENGAAAVMCCEECDCAGAAVIKTDNTQKALLRLAGYYRSLFDIPVVGVTGSVGKTTTKEMLHCVMSAKYKTLKNYGNLNNQIGMPMTVFDLSGEYGAAVFEMGMADFGEISRLSLVARPDIGVITNIGVSHMETLGSRENILKAKLEIIHGMKPDKPLIINADDDLLSNARISGRKIYYYGIESDKCDIRAKNIKITDKGSAFTAVCDKGTVEVQLPCVGKHHIYNALAAIQTGLLLGVPMADAASSLLNYEPTGMRQRLRTVKGITFIEDCYNASPDSMKAAISSLCSMPKQRRIAVLGDMLELGGISDKAHYFTGRTVAESGIDMLFVCGERAAVIAEGARQGGMKLIFEFDDKIKLSEKLVDTLKENDAVLFKASRGIRLEDVLNYIYESIGGKEQ